MVTNQTKLATIFANIRLGSRVDFPVLQIISRITGEYFCYLSHNEENKHGIVVSPGLYDQLIALFPDLPVVSYRDDGDVCYPSPENDDFMEEDEIRLVAPWVQGLRILSFLLDIFSREDFDCDSIEDLLNEDDDECVQEIQNRMDFFQVSAQINNFLSIEKVLQNCQRLDEFYLMCPLK